MLQTVSSNSNLKSTSISFTPLLYIQESSPSWIIFKRYKNISPQKPLGIFANVKSQTTATKNKINNKCAITLEPLKTRTLHQYTNRSALQPRVLSYIIKRYASYSNRNSFIHSTCIIEFPSAVFIHDRWTIVYNSHALFSHCDALSAL